MFAPNFKVLTDLDDGLFITYYKQFIPKMKANYYLDLFEKDLKYNSDEESQIMMYGKKINVPRKQVAYGDAGINYSFSGITVKANDWNADTEICKVIREIKKMVEKRMGSTFNYVLFNRYEDGDQYLGFHKDDEKDLGPDPNIVGISFGAERDIIFKSEKTGKTKTVFLHHGSMVIMHHPTNKYWKHSIPKQAGIYFPRISMTFRKMI